MISNFFSIYINYLKFFRYSNNKNKLYACLVQDKLIKLKHYYLVLNLFGILLIFWQLLNI